MKRNIPVKQQKAIIALLSGATLEKAAKAASVTYSTLWRWLKTAEFRDAYREARREQVAEAMAQLQQGAGEAVQTLREIVKARKAPASARVSAARTMLDALELAKLEEIEDRLTDLEAKENAIAKQSS